jgi:hypothetical protein
MTEEAAPYGDAPSPPPPLPTQPDKSELYGLPIKKRETVILVLLTVFADICLYRSWGGAGIAVLLLTIAAALTGLKGRNVPKRPRKIAAVILALSAISLWSVWWLAILVSVVAIFYLALTLCRPECNLVES